MRHIYGRNNIVTDALSCVELEVHQPIPQLSIYSGWHKHNRRMPECKRIAQLSSNWYLLTYPSQIPTQPCCATLQLTGALQPTVPLAWWHAVFNAIHGLGHPGIKATRNIVTASFVWHGINKQVLWAKICIPARWQRSSNMQLHH